MRAKTVSFWVIAAGISVGSAVACGGQGKEGAPPEAPTSAPAESAAMEAASASAAPAEAPSAAPPAEAAIVGPPKVAWRDMTKEQRGKYMKAVVLPKMKELFTRFDSKEFAEVNCATCHGKGVKAGTFKMPNPDIAVLPSDKAAFGALMKKKPEWVKFMMEKVKPTMAELLALEQFEPDHPKPDTFGCQNCHTMKK